MWSTADMSCSPRLLVASEASSCMKRAVSGTDNSWPTCLGRPVREGFTLATARSNATRRCRRTVKRCRARVARLRRLKMFFDTHSGHVLHRSHSQGPKCKGSAKRAIATKAIPREGIARRPFSVPITARSTTWYAWYCVRRVGCCFRNRVLNR